MTETDVKRIVQDVLIEMGADVDNSQDVPIAESVDESTTLPTIRYERGIAVGFERVNIGMVVASLKTMMSDTVFEFETINNISDI